jgi:hypothetical protein
MVEFAGIADEVVFGRSRPGPAKAKGIVATIWARKERLKSVRKLRSFLPESLVRECELESGRT